MKTNSPTQQDIATRAWEIWHKRGQPIGQDMDIWFEAERQLSTPTNANNVPSATEGRGNGKTQKGQTAADPKPADLKPKSDWTQERWANSIDCTA